MTSGARSSLRQRADRVSYREPSSDEDGSLAISDEEIFVDTVRDVTRRPPRPRRSLRRHAPASHPSEPPAKRLRPPPRVRTSVASNTHERRLPSRPKQRRRVPAFASRPANTTRAPQRSTTARHIPSDGRIPPWSTLPFEIIRSILDFASYPLRSPDLLALPQVGWLLGYARVCKAFLKPALAVLYYEPPLSDVADPHKLLERVYSDTNFLDYGSLVKHLHVDAHRILSYSWSGGLISLTQLLAKLPRLARLDLTDPVDRPPYRTMTRGRAWTYPPELFTILDSADIKLRGWRWHAHMMRQGSTTLPDEEATLLSHHRKAAFQNVEHLALSHFEVANKMKKRSAKATPLDGGPGIEQPPVDGTLGRILSPLTQLRSVELVSCQAEPWTPVLQQLPECLEHLSISNSTFLNAEAVREFLVTKGRKLRTLVLDHNQALSLQFLPDLKRSCPRLERLHMDLTYYNSIAQYRDSDPLFDSLMLADDVPTWPSTLEGIELYHLRQWEQPAAEVFFSSLLDSAVELPHLRTLMVKAILNINWRERAGFRSKWEGRLHRIFADRSPLPNPALASVKAFRLSKGIFKEDEMNDEENDVIMTGSGIAGKKQISYSHAPAEESPTKIARRSGRIKESEQSQKAAARAAAEMAAARDAEPNSPGSTSSDNQDDWQPDFIHGRCNIVDVSIDNLRPGEMLFTEGDFLDDEVSGDEDWNGDNDRDEGTSYAW